MNRLAFQTYGTKKLSLFQSVWKTTENSVVSTTEQAGITATGTLTNWALTGTTLVNGGYNHTTGSAAVLQFSLPAIQGQSYQMKYTVTGTGSVTINFGGVSSAPLFAGTDVIITMTPITTATLSITPLSTFVGNISLSIKQSSSAANQIQLPITVASGKSVWVDWGDGQYSTMNSANFYANRIHTYAASGEYPVRVFGDDFSFGFGSTNSVNDRLKIKSISSWGKLKLGQSSFNSCSNLTMSGITDIPNLTGVTNLSVTFAGCIAITTIGRINEWNTSLVANISGMFSACSNFNSDISNWNVSSVTTIADMFNGASNFNQPIGNWERVSSPDTSTLLNCTNAFALFKTASAFNQSIGNWNVSGVTNMLDMFRGASNFNNGFASGVANQLPWPINTTAASVSMESMFTSATAFNSNLGTGTTPWNVSKVTTFAGMFSGASKFTNGLNTAPINNWNIGGNVTSVSLNNMFTSASVFNRDISGWSVSKATSTSSMFQNASSFNQPLSNWERSTVGNVSTMGNMTNLYAMFFGSAFNQNIGNWNVTKVTQFAQMFQASGFNNGGSPDINNWVINTTPGANILMNGMFATTGFNQPLNGWNTSEVTTMNLMFGQSTFNNGLSSGAVGTLVWNTGKVTNMSLMFSSNTRFNCNIGSWDVSACTTFASMFEGATTFNNGGSPDINNWFLKATGDISMAGMFKSASVFNQPIGSWNVSRVNIMNDMFNGASNFNQSLSNWERVSSPDTSTLANVTTMLRMFANASEFNNGLAVGLPDTLTWNTIGVTDMGQMFDTATAFNCDIGGFNVSNCANFGFMFRGAQTGTASRFNNGGSSSIGTWTLKSTGSISMWYMFGKATAFNQPIGAWNTSRVTTMQTMFSTATAFNQNIGSWNVSLVSNFSGFMENKTFNDFSTANLNAIYNGWIVNGVQPNISSPLSTNISFGTIKYTAAGTPGKNILLASPNNWIIQDGGI